jgi:hypothetical protein
MMDSITERLEDAASRMQAAERWAGAGPLTRETYLLAELLWGIGVGVTRGRAVRRIGGRASPDSQTHNEGEVLTARHRGKPSGAWEA